MLALFAALASAPDTEVSPLQEVVVTAQRREQAARDVPGSLTAFSGEALERLGARDLRDVALLTPGVVVQEKSPANANTVVRGVSTDDGSSYQEPRVSVFQDGVSIARSRGAFVELFDLERVEIVRGPQSTLFGRNALAGALNIVSRAPEAGRWDLSASGDAGSYGYGRAFAALNAPLSPDLTLRIAGQYRRRDGYVDDVLGGPALGGFDTGAVRAILAWRPDSRLQSDLIVGDEHDGTTGTPYKSHTFDPADPATGRVLGDRSLATGLAAAEPDGFTDGRRLGDRRRVWNATWRNSYAFGPGLKLISTSAVRGFDSRELYDLDGLGLPLVGAAEEVSDTQYSQEFRLQYDEGGRFGWTLGASGFGDDGRHRVPLQINEPDLLALFTGYLDRRNPVAGPQSLYASPQVGALLLQGLAGASQVALPSATALGIARNLQGAQQETYTDLSRTAAYDLFADGVWRPTARLELEGGLRYTDDRKTTGYAAQVANGRSVLGSVIAALGLAEPARSGLLAALSAPGAARSTTLPVPLLGLVVQPTTGNGGKVEQDLDDEGVSGRASARYRLSDAVTTYLTYARGRRPEVLTAGAPAAPFAAPVFTAAAAETLDLFEGGAKAAFWGGRLRLDASAYGERYRHFQTVQQQGARFLTVDAGDATIYGAELQAQATPIDGVQLFANYAWTHARFDNGLYGGNRLRLTPDHAVSAGAVLSHAAPGGAVSFASTFSWRSKVFFNDDNANPALLTGAFVRPLVFDEVQGGYGLLNLRVGYARPAQGWRVEIFANNATGKDYLKDAGDSGQAFGLPTYVTGDPRLVGVTLAFTR